MLRRLLLPLLLSCALGVSSSGCGPATVDMSSALRAAHLAELDAAKDGVAFNEHTKSIELTARPGFDASDGAIDRLTVVPYHRLLWAVMKMPVIVGRAQDGRPSLILLDSGLTLEEAWDVAELAAMYNLTNRMAMATNMLPNPEYSAQARP